VKVGCPVADRRVVRRDRGVKRLEAATAMQVVTVTLVRFARLTHDLATPEFPPILAMILDLKAACRAPFCC